jgi:hypothetical protein
MNDKLKAITLCLLVIAALIAASAFVPRDSQYDDNPYPGVVTPDPYPIIEKPEPTKEVKEREKVEKTEKTEEFYTIEDIELKR